MSDWLDDAPATTSDDTARARPPVTVVEAVAAGIADVSPAWAAVTDHQGAPDAASEVRALGRDRARALESIREGWLLHRGASRVAAGASPDLALLVGDWCYAAGLCTIADHGTLDDVAALAQLVADVSSRAAESIDDLAPRWAQTAEALRHG